jgi:hypothetical protein
MNADERRYDWQHYSDLAHECFEAWCLMGDLFCATDTGGDINLRVRRRIREHMVEHQSAALNLLRSEYSELGTLASGLPL